MSRGEDKQERLAAVVRSVLETGTPMASILDMLARVAGDMGWHGVCQHLTVMARELYSHGGGRTGCPTCNERVAQLTPDDRARIPLRQAANAFYEAGDRVFEHVREHGRDTPAARERDAELQARQDRCDDELAKAAIVYAAAVRTEKP